MRWTILLTLLAFSSVTIAGSVKSLNISILKDDPCYNAMLDRYIWVKTSGSVTELLSKPIQDRYRAAERLGNNQLQTGKYNALNGPWDIALIPVHQIQRDAIDIAFLGLDTQGSLPNLKAVKDFLTVNQNRKMTPLIEAIAKAFGGSIRTNKDLSTQKDKAYEERRPPTILLAAACSQVSVYNAYSCTQAVEKLLELSQFNSNMVFLNIWKEFATDKKLQEGARVIALKMIDRIETNEAGSLFEDLVDGFKKVGFDLEDAKDSTWKLLLMYGNGGPNLGMRMILQNQDLSVLYTAMTAIGMAIGYLDFNQRLLGKPSYAYPQEVTGSCLTPKPYHFWMNAFFARTLVKGGFSPTIAQLATFVAAKGYQMNRDVNGSTAGLDKILSKPSDHPTNRVIRSDLAMGAAGAVYGSLVESQTIKAFSIQEGMKYLTYTKGDPKEIEVSTINMMTPDSRMKAYMAWEQLFNPNGVLKYFKDIQK
jgi:hypothetical protein